MRARAILPCLLVAALAAGCGGDGEPERPSPTTSAPEPTLSSPPPVQTFELWFASDGKLFLSRGTARASGPLKVSIETLMEGPSAAEGQGGVETAIAPGTRVDDVFNTAGLTIVDLSSEFGRTGASPERILAFAQIVYTATQFDGVDGVLIRVDGKPVKGLNGSGDTVNHALKRSDYEALLPAIVVESPSPGQVLTSPVTVSGTADVFEATVSIRILDGEGRSLQEAFTTATCGTGCRGEYSAEVQFDVEQQQPGTVEVFESSAESGEAVNVVRIPVTLSPR